MRHLWMTGLAGLLLVGIAGALSAGATGTAAHSVDDPGRQRMIDASYELAIHLGR